MVEPAILTGLGWLVSPLTKMLLEKGCSYLGTKAAEERRKTLGAIVIPYISLAIEAAEKSANKDKIQFWLRSLKDAYYETEEAIDLFEYEQLKQKVTDERKTFRQKINNERKSTISLSGLIFRPPKFAPCKSVDAVSILPHQMVMPKGPIDTLLEIVKEVKEFLGFFSQAPEQDSNRESYALPPRRVFGRENDKEKIVSLILRELKVSESGPSNLPSGIPVVAIVGRSGVGKTTLAQNVHKYIEEQNYSFDHCIWVHAPRKFKAADVINKMTTIIKEKQRSLSNNCSSSLETLTIEMNNMWATICGSPLETLRSEISLLLGSKKVLLVLDDFWCETEEDEGQWEKLVNCICSSSPKSKILLTTQLLHAAKRICVSKEDIYELEQLEEDHLFDLLMYHALPTDCPMQEEELKKIGRKVTVKLEGDPHAAKLLGSLMRENIDIKHWEEISNKEWLGDSMKARIWSYQQLPVDLQRCFAFCSLFPKGFKFRGQMLINLWMAEGFIKPTDNNYNRERMEDIAKNNLEELVHRYFLEKSEEYYFLHDLFHNLAERVGCDDYFRVEYKNYGEIPSKICSMLSRNENVRHLSLNASMVNKIKDILCLKKNLRTLIILDDDAVLEKDLKEILRNLRKLRVLYIPYCKIEDLPNCIGNLKHLRYLNVFGCPLQKLPDSICQLYHLQFLALSSCELLPTKFSELISLRHFDTDKGTVSKICNVGRLTSLETLSKFCIKPEDGHELQQLDGLEELQGSLHIKGLENLKCKEDAVKARLGDKTHLDALELEWNGNGQVTNDAEILEALKPHPNVKELHIFGYRGRRLPDWLLSQNSGRYLNALNLWDCNGIEELNSINQCLPSCKFLILNQLDGLKNFPPLPSKLIFAYVDLPLLLSFVSSDDLLMDERKRSTLEVAKQIAEHCKLPEAVLPSNFLPTVQNHVQLINIKLKAAPQIIRTSQMCQNFLLKIESVDDIKNVSGVELLDMWAMGMERLLKMMFHRKEEVRLDLPSSLATLWIANGSITNQALSMCLEKLVLLTELHLNGILTITSLPPEHVLCALKNLEKLEIEKCYLLTSLGGIKELTSLRTLKLCECPEFKSQDTSLLPPRLENLEVKECANIDVIIKRSILPNMHTLEIWDCSIQKIHLTHLSSLKKMILSGCPKLSSLEGLSLLSELDSLSVWSCPRIGLSSPGEKSSCLKTVRTDNLLTLELMLSDGTISKLEGLLISHFDGDSIADDIFDHVVSSLKWLGFCFNQNTSLPKNLKGLATLQHLYIKDCPNLRELTALPESLRLVEIENCPNLKERCKRNGPDWHMIAHVPYKDINW